MAQRLRNHMMSFPICGLSSSVRLALVALDSTSDVRNTADSNLKVKARLAERMTKQTGRKSFLLTDVLKNCAAFTF